MNYSEIRLGCWTINYFYYSHILVKEKNLGYSSMSYGNITIKTPTDGYFKSDPHQKKSAIVQYQCFCFVCLRLNIHG